MSKKKNRVFLFPTERLSFRRREIGNNKELTITMKILSPTNTGAVTLSCNPPLKKGECPVCPLKGICKYYSFAKFADISVKVIQETTSEAENKDADGWLHPHAESTLNAKIIMNFTNRLYGRIDKKHTKRIK